MKEPDSRDVMVRITSLTIIQLFIFFVIYEGIRYLYGINIGEIRHDYSYGIRLHYSKFILIFLAIINSFSKILFIHKSSKFLVALLCTAVWVVFWSNIVPEMPYRSGLVMFAGISGLFSISLLSSESKSFNYSMS